MALPRQRRTADLTQLIAEHLHRAARLMRELPADWRDDPALPLGSPQQIMRELAMLDSPAGIKKPAREPGSHRLRSARR